MRFKLVYTSIILCCFFLRPSTLIAQRYQSQIFDAVKKQTVIYAEAEQLKMDIYEPASDTLSKRPIMLFVHGGGFAGGARDEPEIEAFCRNMARRGIVAASMSYTLVMKGKSFGCDQTAKNKLNTFKQVGNEISLATNYLLDHELDLNIDPKAIILAGSSAGAEAVLHAAFWEEARTPLDKTFNYAGLISMAGAIHNLDWITAESAIPMQFFHGTCDDLVPYGSAPHHYCQPEDDGYLMLHGPGSITKKLEYLNSGYYLITGCNDNHSWAGKPFKQFRAEIADFIYHDVLLKKTRQLHYIINDLDACQLNKQPSVCTNP